MNRPKEKLKLLALLQSMTSNCHTFCLFWFIIVQKWYLLGKCSQIVTIFCSFLGKKCDNLRSWTVHGPYNIIRVIYGRYMPWV